MKLHHYFTYNIILLLSSCLFLSGCLSNLNPVEPQQPSYNTPAKQTSDFTVVYNYGDTGQVQLSNNNLELKVGQKLTLQPAPGLTSNTRFVSSGEYFFGDIMEQDTTQTDTTKAVFTAIKAGKGKLQIIPNGTETDRAADLWVTVQ